MKIPKIIHFIWAGGDYPMPKNYINTMLTWRQKNPDFEIYLWIDPKSTSDIQQLKDYYINKGVLENHIEFKDIETEQVANEFIRYEIDRLRPNYGASSDLLRYRILDKFGGAYFDTDVLPGSQSLSESKLFEEDLPCHRLYVDNNSQNTKQIGNDALISTPNNPHIKLIYRVAERNYTAQKEYELKDDEYKLEAKVDDVSWNIPNWRLYSYDDITPDQNGYIFFSTPRKTGPGSVRAVVAQVVNVSKDQDQYSPRVISMVQLTQPAQENGRRWTAKELPTGWLIERCRVALKTTILFEAKHLKIFRLDDHISNLIKVNEFKEGDAFNEIVKLIDDLSIELKHLDIQLTFSYKNSINYCQQMMLLDKTYLLPLSDYCKQSTRSDEYYEPVIQDLVDLRKIKKDFKEKKIDEADFYKFAREKVTRGLELIDCAISYCRSLEQARAANTESLIDNVQNYFRFLRQLMNEAVNDERIKDSLTDELKVRCHDALQILEQLDREYTSRKLASKGSKKQVATEATPLLQKASAKASSQVESYDDNEESNDQSCCPNPRRCSLM